MSDTLLILFHGLLCAVVGWLASDIAHARPEAVIKVDGDEPDGEEPESEVD